MEAMFPGYLFAKFVYGKQHRAVESSHGIRGIVHFGDRLATLSEDIMVALQSRVGAEEVVTVDSSIKVGQPVQITKGPFHGSNYQRAFSRIGGRGYSFVACERTDSSSA